MTLRRIGCLAPNTRVKSPNTTQFQQCGTPLATTVAERAGIHVVASQCRGACTPTPTSDVPVMVLVKAILECILVMIYNNVLSMHAVGSPCWQDRLEISGTR